MQRKNAEAVDNNLSIWFTCGFRKLKNNQEHLNCFCKSSKRFKWFCVELDFKSIFYERSYSEILCLYSVKNWKKLYGNFVKFYFLSYSLFSILLTLRYVELTTAVFTVQYLVIQYSFLVFANNFYPAASIFARMILNDNFDVSASLKPLIHGQINLIKFIESNKFENVYSKI